MGTIGSKNRPGDVSTTVNSTLNEQQRQAIVENNMDLTPLNQDRYTRAGVKSLKSPIEDEDGGIVKEGGGEEDGEDYSEDHHENLPSMFDSHPPKLLVGFRDNPSSHIGNTDSQFFARLKPAHYKRSVKFKDIEVTLRTGDLALLYCHDLVLPHFAIFINQGYGNPLLLVKAKTRPLLLSQFDPHKLRYIHTITATMQRIHGDYARVVIQQIQSEDEINVQHALDAIGTVEAIPFSQTEIQAIIRAKSPQERSLYLSTFMAAYYYQHLGIFHGAPDQVTPENFRDHLPLSDPIYVELPSNDPLSQLTDKRAQEIIDKALETSSLPLRNVVAVLTGLTGSGKTWFLARLFNQPPPDLYTSTGITEQSCRGLLHHIANTSLNSWQLFTHRNILEFLACRFREDLPPADVAQLATKIAAFSVPAASVAPPPASSARQKPRKLQKKSDTSQSMVRLVKAPKSSQSQAMLELVHMIDTGGQPELMENMPSLVHNCHLAVLILNLMFGLDEYPPIHYHEKGKAYKRALPSQHSNRQIIQKLASTLQAKRFSHKVGQCFRLLVVATHRDCVPRGELAARVKAFNQALESILLPGCEEELIRFSADIIPFVLNLKEPDSTDLTKLELIRDKISESGVGEVIEMPSSFLIFEQELVEFAKKEAYRDVLSLEQCLQVGAKLKMESEVVMAALIFFHRQITLLYFRYVLPNVVFTKPQVPLDFINFIVQFSYKVASSDTKCITSKLASSLRDGIITEETLSHDLLKNCFITNLYEPHHAIDLLCHTFTLAPLSREPQSKTGSSPAVWSTPSTPIKRERREYLMMSLRPAIPDKDIPQYIPPPSEIAPLVVKFSKDCVPLSCFSSTISCLLSMYDWRLSRADNGSPECLAHNVVSLYDPQLPVQIILVDATNHLQIHIRPEKDVDKNIFPKICFHICETIFSAIPKVFETLKLEGIDISPAFLCSCSRASSEPHSASAYQSLNSTWFLRCSKTEKSIGTALEKQTMWLEAPVTEKEKPSLPKLLQLEVPQKVGAKYEVFGCFLLNDEDGSLIEAMEVDCQGKCERIVRKTLAQWIRGRGKPLTWETLTETLRVCKLTTFADYICKTT